MLNDRLPSAGERAKKIQGRLKDLRGHWNTHASHFGVTHESVSHLLRLGEDRLQVRQPFSSDVLRQNMKHIFVFGCWAALEALRSLAIITGDPQEAMAQQLKGLHDGGLRLFGIVEGAA